MVFARAVVPYQIRRQGTGVSKLAGSRQDPAPEAVRQMLRLGYRARRMPGANSILANISFGVKCDNDHKNSIYISVHDQPERVWALDDLDSQICFEADYLGRFGAEGDKRLGGMMGPRVRQKDLEAFLANGSRKWFRTKSSICLLKNKLKELRYEIE